MSPLSPVHAALRLTRSAVGLVFGVVEGVADTVLDVIRPHHDASPTSASTDGRATHTDTGPAAGADTDTGAPAADAVTEPAPQRQPAATPPPVTTEPKPMASDDWEEELMDELADEYGDEADGADGAGRTGGTGGTEGDSLFGDRPDEPSADDEPILDPAVAKGVRKESETMRRAADREPEDRAGE